LIQSSERRFRIEFSYAHDKRETLSRTEIFVVNELDDGGSVNEISGGFLHDIINDFRRRPGPWNCGHSFVVLVMNSGEFVLQISANIFECPVDVQGPMYAIEGAYIEYIAYMGFWSAGNEKSKQKRILPAGVAYGA
jgi:hypothetical protein